MSDRPNIMLLQGEDVGLHLGCYGHDYAMTPNLDRLASEGARYDNAFSHAPVCAPSRGGMATGCYPWAIGNHHMRSKLLDPPRNFTHELRDAGYSVSWPTKLDFNFEPQDGWCDDRDPWWEKPAPDGPFFVYQNFNTTHESRMFGTLPEWAKDVLADLPDELRHDPASAPLPSYFPDTPELRRQIATYFDALSYIDMEIGQRLQWLEESGQADNTIVIFLSDHGRGLPREKRWCYDAGVHMPLLVRWPGSIDPGTVVDELVAWVDMAPTLLSLGGASIPEHYHGQVFLGPDKASPREYAFSGRDRMDGVFDKVRSVRDKRYRYIRNDFPGLPWAQRQSYMEQQPIMPVMRTMWASGELRHGPEASFFAERKPLDELYDAHEDPEMINNLADDPTHAETLARLKQALADELARTGDLGETCELDLIEQGLVENRLVEYRSRYEPLPPEQRIGPEPFPMVLREARVFARDWPRVAGAVTR